jgi:hypothetical protein
MATPTASAALDASPGLATVESPTATLSFSNTATPSATGASSDDAQHNTKMSNLYLCVSNPPSPCLCILDADHLYT